MPDLSVTADKQAGEQVRGQNFDSAVVMRILNVENQETYVLTPAAIYSLPDDKLVWAGRSRTLDPRAQTTLAEATVSAVISELRKQGLIR